ncbi:RNA polymerase sigma factor, sigma-70 family [Thermanaerovibrio velox DSM 12556]|uniref:RNA polymerase sigma factor, sigma-70 family n=1 Tax=Thermanaerovibrio velox DSM 12556 TaxID=926567 RepID=H0UQ00_9BACT|nr:sigma-70 family RNA polymerase sigma factor [Thermanaerovibrio velox]EHM09629.1 RNA polymerase sigma factor, sigma-70 family [Thermanaerovibrio velox DSM 12556]
MSSGPLVEGESPEVERDLWERVRSGDEDAREEAILSMRPMVFWLAKRIGAPGVLQDLVQEGMVGLIEAVDNFDPSRGLKFSTYAYYRIRGRMINFLTRVEAPSPIPVEDSVLEERTVPLMPGVDSVDWAVDLELAMGILSDRESSVVRALVLEDRSAKEVAESKGLDVSYIHKIRRRALAKLREVLGHGAT